MPWYVVVDDGTWAHRSKDSGKIKCARKDVEEFWCHWERHEPVKHPACEQKRHVPVGLAGDDAKYTLSGSKLIVMLLSFPLQDVMRTLDYYWSNICLIPETHKICFILQQL